MAPCRLQGNIPGVAVDHMDGVSYLVPVGSITWGLKASFYDVDSADEVRVSINGVDQGFVPVTVGNAWGQKQQFTIYPDRGLTVVEILNAFNPPSTETWGVTLSQPMINIPAIMTIINSILLD